VLFHSIEVREVTGKGTFTRGAPATADAGWQNAINLLPLIDPQKDAVAGRWKAGGGALSCASGNDARIEIPYRPPEEYDYRIEFTPQSGDADVDLILSKSGRQVRWATPDIVNKVFGFDLIDGLKLEDRGNPSRKSGELMQNGQRYTALVQVRNDGLRAYMDGTLVISWQTDYHNTSLFPGAKLRDGSVLGLRTHRRATVFHRIEVREVTGKGTFTRGGPPAADAAWQNAINLLPLIDPQKDAVAGQWTFEKGELVGDKDAHGRIEIPYQPPEEYDYRVEFTVEGGGTSGAGQILSKAGHDFAWVCFAGRGTVFGFDTVGGKSVHLNPTKTEGPPLRKRQRYVSLVTVRNDDVRGYLDGALIVEWKTNYADMGIRENIWKLRTPGLLGVNCQHRIVFHRIEVREVTGKGTFTRGAPASASNTPPLQHSTVPAALSAFCAEVATLPAEQQVARVVDELKKRNPGYDGMKRHKIQDGQVIELELWTEHISDISPVRALPSLQNFYCTGPTDQNSQPTGKKGILADLSPLRGMHLTRFKCRYNQLSNLSPLAGHSLIYMECEAHPQVTDLSPLKGMPLTNLLIIGCGVSDLSPLKGLPLKQLRFDEALLSKGQNREILRSIKTLEKINNKPAVELWKKVDAGEVPKP
jgi:hypothetical protein